MKHVNTNREAKSKKAFSKPKRKVGIVLPAVSALFAVFMLVRSFLPTSAEEEVVHASYDFAADTQILATLEDNSLYAEDTLSGDTIIPFQLTRAIEATVTAQFVSNIPLELQSGYTVEISLGGVQASGETFVPIYTIRIPVSEGVFIQDEANPNVWAVNHTFPLDMADYSRQITTAAELIGISPELDCKIVFSGSYAAETANGSMAETFTHSTVLPVSEELILLAFQAEEPLSVSGQIAATEVVVTPAVGFGLGTILCLIWLVLSVLAFLFFFFKTRDCNEAELFLELKKKILRKYGSRMIVVASFPDFSKVDCVAVYNIENLLLISEDVRRPVFYCKDEKTLICENRLFLQDSDTFYILELKGALPENTVPSETEDIPEDVAKNNAEDTTLEV